MSEGMKDTIQFAVKNEKALKKENQLLREALIALLKDIDDSFIPNGCYYASRKLANQALNGTQP